MQMRCDDLLFKDEVYSIIGADLQVFLGVDRRVRVAYAEYVDHECGDVRKNVTLVTEE